MKGIIFSEAMVESILDGYKFQTRRLVQPGEEDAEPFGPVGELLWVREGFNVGGRPGSENTYVTYRAKSADEKRALAEWNRRHGLTGANAETRLFYEIAKPRESVVKLDKDVRERWRTARFMPQWASRIHLRLAAQRVERLWAITDEDAKAEGVVLEPTVSLAGSITPYRVGYHRLWQGLHKEPGTRWDDNPKVRVIDFKVERILRGGRLEVA